MRSVHLAIVCVPLSLALAGGAKAECRGDKLAFNLLTDRVAAEVTVKNTEVYAEVFLCNNPGNLTSISHFVVTRRPSHGVAGINNSLGSPGFAYKPNPRFVGKDHVDMAVDVHSGYTNATHVMTISLDIDVVP